MRKLLTLCWIPIMVLMHMSASSSAQTLAGFNGLQNPVDDSDEKSRIPDASATISQKVQNHELRGSFEKLTSVEKLASVPKDPALLLKGDESTLVSTTKLEGLDASDDESSRVQQKPGNGFTQIGAVVGEALPQQVGTIRVRPAADDEEFKEGVEVDVTEDAAEEERAVAEESDRGAGLDSLLSGTDSITQQKPDSAFTHIGVVQGGRGEAVPQQTGPVRRHPDGEEDGAAEEREEANAVDANGMALQNPNLVYKEPEGEGQREQGEEVQQQRAAARDEFGALDTDSRSGDAYGTDPMDQRISMGDPLFDQDDATPFVMFPPLPAGKDEGKLIPDPAATFSGKGATDRLRRQSECLRFLQFNSARVGVQFQVYSQNNEDGLLMGLFECIGALSKAYVEFGTEDGRECNTRYLRQLHGWSGLMMDGGFENERIGLKKEFIAVEGVVQLFEKYRVPRYFDLLSVDTDLYDLFLIDRILRAGYRPRAIVSEINRNFFPREAFSVVYSDSQGRWDMKSAYMGASTQAIDRLLSFYGYTFVLIDSSGINAFFVRNDLVDPSFLLPVHQFYTAYPHLHSDTQHATWLHVPLYTNFSDPFWFYTASSPPRPSQPPREDPVVIRAAAGNQMRTLANVVAAKKGTAASSMDVAALRKQLPARYSTPSEVSLDHVTTGRQHGWEVRHFHVKGSPRKRTWTAEHP